MTDTVRDLVDAMVQGDALGTEKAFGAAMAEKLSSKLEDMRTNVAQTMFATEEEVEIEAAVEEPVEMDSAEDSVEETPEEEQDNLQTPEEEENA